MPEINVIEAVRQAMYEEMSRDPEVFLIGEDVGKRGGVFLASEGFKLIDTNIKQIPNGKWKEN